MTGAQLWLPIAVTAFSWWFSTGLILLLVRAPRRFHTMLLIAFAGLALLSGWGIAASAQSEKPSAVYCGFICALVIWGWHEASFLMGKITGPRPLACPDSATGWRRFGYATATLIYHEIALFVTLIGIAALTWGAPNQIGLWIFGLLFAMRLSAKFNIFLGVPNLSQEFFPVHLDHLKSYLPKRAMNPLMPLSLLVSAALAIWLWQRMGLTVSGTGAMTALAIVFTLTCLGIIEHLFMITPLPDAALWRWASGVSSRDTSATEASSTPAPLSAKKKTENA